MENSTNYDLIVVGLSCAGLSTAHYYASQKEGAKVLGLEMNKESGDEGTSSYGDTRLFNYNPGFEMRNEMLADSLKVWKELEEKTGKKLVYDMKLLNFGDKEKRPFKDALKEYGEDKMLTPQHIMEKYPALENLPDNYTGYIEDRAGLILSKDALGVYKDLCKELNVELKYETKVTEVHKNEVKIEDGTTYTADNVVVATGPFTKDQFNVDEPDLVSVEQEFYELVDKSGLPDMFQESSELGSYNGCVNKHNLEQYKVGLHDKRNYEKMCEWAKKRIPSKAEEIISNPKSHICKWCYVEGKQFEYNTSKEGVHFLYGFRGHSFAYMPIHGRIVYDTLLGGKALKYVK